MSDNPTAVPELSNAALHVLLALADGEAHGYAIMQTVIRESQGRVRLGPTTLYRTLRTLLEDGLIEELSNGDDGNGDARRRYYRITDPGQHAARMELTRLESLLQWARGKTRLHGGASS
jgi:DNA-binding PadR family transcriptional regulator